MSIEQWQIWGVTQSERHLPNEKIELGELRDDAKRSRQQHQATRMQWSPTEETHLIPHHKRDAFSSAPSVEHEASRETVPPGLAGCAVQRKPVYLHNEKEGGDEKRVS